MSRCHLDISQFHLPLFYHDLIAAWKQFRSYFHPKTARDICFECLWFNPFITVNKNTIFYKHWYRKGIRFIGDIVDNAGEFLNVDILEAKFDIQINFLEYYSLRSAIPREWKQKLCSAYVNFREGPSTLYFMIGGVLKNIKHITCKDFYWCIIANSLKDGPTCVNKWRELFNIEHEEWESIFSLSFKCTMESKLQAFQFSILHRFVVHNSRLYRMGLVDSELCNLCAAKDTIIHRYWECRYVNTFWSYFEDWYNKYSPRETISLSLKDVIFGFFHKQSCYTLNNCLLTAKYYIHKELCKKENISFAGYLNYLKYKISVEQHILNSQGKQHIFEKRWSTIVSGLL